MVKRVVPAVLVGGVVLSLAACTGSSDAAAVRAAQAFLSAVGSGQTGRAAIGTTDVAAAQTALAASRAGLGSSARATFRVSSSTEDGAHASVSFDARWTVAPGAKPWTYTGHLTLDRRNSRWLVHWTPAVEHPALRAGTHLAVRYSRPARAALLDSTEQPLFRATPVVNVGIEPKLVDDLPKLARQLAAVPALESSAREIESAVRGAVHRTDFVPVITLRRSVYEMIRDRIHDLPGTVFRTGTEQLTYSSHFGQPLLGRVGPATARIAADSHGRVPAGAEAGLGGLEQAYDSVLAGTPGIEVGVVDDRTGARTRLATLSGPRPGRPVRLTLDARVQRAADDALAKVNKAASIVAVQPSSGRILADANSVSATYDIGLAGALPPGSTFKIASWAAAFTQDRTLTPATSVPCPATTTVDGRVFSNENRFAHPPIPISASFGYSCNTSAIHEVMRLPVTAVAAAARRLGLGATWRLPVTAFSGSVPTPAGATEQGADAIGQGRVLTSPLAMALMAGAAATGYVRTPTIDQASAPDATEPAKRALPSRLVRDMTTLMRATVDMPGGTAHTLASFDGLIGKTGTAEYGNARPPRTHTWFVGVQHDLAFAVFIYDGATDGRSALPVVARFLAGVR